jgi:hypothetical protein
MFSSSLQTSRHSVALISFVATDSYVLTRMTDNILLSQGHVRYTVIFLIFSIQMGARGGAIC